MFPDAKWISEPNTSYYGPERLGQNSTIRGRPRDVVYRLGEKEIQLNLCKFFYILVFNELHLFVLWLLIA